MRLIDFLVLGLLFLAFALVKSAPSVLLVLAIAFIALAIGRLATGERIK
jgi:hypothetical protein